MVITKKIRSYINAFRLCDLFLAYTKFCKPKFYYFIMPRCSLSFVTLFLLFPIFSFAQTSSIDSKSETITYILEETSIQEELNRSINEIESQFSQNPFGLPSSKNDQMMKLFAEHFEPKTMGNSIKQTFQNQYDANHAQTTVEWLNDTTTQKVLDFEKEFYTLQGIRKRVVNKYELEQSPPARKRIELLEALIKNMSAGQMEIESRTIIFRAMVSALSQISSQRSFSESQIDTFVQNFRSQLQTQINQELTNRLLVKYHGLNNQLLQKYLSFYDTDAGNWLSDTTAKAVHAALENSSATFLKAIDSIQ